MRKVGRLRIPIPPTRQVFFTDLVVLALQYLETKIGMSEMLPESSFWGDN